MSDHPTCITCSNSCDHGWRNTVDGPVCVACMPAPSLYTLVVPDENEHYLPRSVMDPLCPEDHPVETPQDRRWLWHIEGFMAVNATTNYQRAMVRVLRRYLNDTCDHHWHESTGYDDEPLRQCLWCNDVEWWIEGQWKEQP